MVARAVLFDFGGTLNTDGDHWGVLFRERLREVNGDLDDETLKRAYVLSERRLVAEGLDTETFRDTLRKQLAYQYDEIPGELPIASEDVADEFYDRVVERMRNVRDLFARFSALTTLGIVSNFYGNLESVCREFDLEPYLDVIVDSARLGIRKPDPRIWTTAIDRAGIDPSETVIVGDSHKNDIAPGRDLGAVTVWYRGKEWSATDDERTASYEVNSLDSLQSLLFTLVSESD